MSLSSKFWNQCSFVLPAMHADTIKNTAVIIALAIVYFIASKFGLALAFTAKQISAVWPPTGIALAAVILFGPRVWPGIAIGAFLANVTTSEPAVAACGIAIGNTLEAVTGAWLVRKARNFDPKLRHLSDVLNLVLRAAIFATMISATFGVTSLCLGGVQPWHAYSSMWALWWVGDATGAIIVAPLLLVWCSQPYIKAKRNVVIESLCLAAGFIALCAFLFSKLPIRTIHATEFLYLVYIFVIWAAIRFGQHATTLITVFVSGAAIWATLHHLGPFIDMAPDQNLAVLQIFVSLTAMTGLFLSAAISERKQAEKALQASNDKKDEFLTLLAHELRNPLASISGALHVAQLPAVSAEQRTKAYSIMDRQLDQTVRLVEDLIDVARISHGKIELRRAPVMLNEAIAIAAETVEPLMQLNRHKFLVDLPPENIWLHADLTRLSQIFINLLNNAAKYSPAEGRIRLTAEIEGNMVAVSVRDSGIGIAADLLPSVFDMFMQAEHSAPRSRTGLGVGLTLVKRLAEMHGGNAEARSAGAGKGSEFIIRLPLIAAPKTSIPAPVVSRTTQESRKLKVLLADDNESFAATFGHLLELIGHEVKLSHNGPDALRVARSFVPDVVLLDIGLPDISGYDVCKQLRAMPAMKHCLIIAQTGFSQQEHRERSRAAGFDHHLIKPIKLDSIEALLRPLGVAVGRGEDADALQKTG